MASIAIEFQDQTGNWIRIRTGVMNSSQVIRERMAEVKKMKPHSRVRAVDEKTGQLVDIFN